MPSAGHAEGDDQTVLADVDAVEQQGHQVEVIQRRRLPGLELCARPRHEPPADGALARAPARDVGAERLQAARVLARGHAHQHLLDHAAIQGIGRSHRLERRQRDFAVGRPHTRALDDHFPPAQHDLARDDPGPAGRAIRFVGIPRAANHRPILLEHGGEYAQARPDGQLQQLGLCVDQQIDQRQMTHRRFKLGNNGRYARLCLHGGSFSVRPWPQA